MKADRPLLGICLGAQMMAHVLGARVYKDKWELGWTAVDATTEGDASPVQHFCDAATKVLSWHTDTFGLPDGATRLASSAAYENQAFGIGRAMGLQFHCELTPASIRDWAVSCADLVADGTLDLRRLHAETTQYGPRMMTRTEQFLSDWLHSVGISENAHDA